MDHRLVNAMQNALKWSGPSQLGVEFARGSVTDPALCARLLTPTRLLDVIMRRSLSFPQLRLVEADNDVHPGRYLKDLPDRRGASVRVPDMRKLARLLRSGCTLVLDTVDFFDPTMEATCRALQWWSRELVQVNIYLTTKDAAGFDLHWDDHDVIIIQLAGQKSWEVRGASRNAPMFRDSTQNTEPSEEIVWQGTMSTGDVMHIPRGYWHRATRTDRGRDGYSLHATFGFVKRTGVNWMAWLADRCREQEAFRVDLDRWGSIETRALEDKNLIAEAARFIATHPPSDFLLSRSREWEPGRHVSTFGIFGAPHTTVCVTPFPPDIIDNGDTVEVLTTGKKITLAKAALPAVSLLLSGHPVDLGEARDALGIDVRRIADTFVAEEICAELTTELASGYAELISPATP